MKLQGKNISDKKYHLNCQCYTKLYENIQCYLLQSTLETSPYVSLFNDE